MFRSRGSHGDRRPRPRSAFQEAVDSMPELPEVETIARDLDAQIVGHRIVDVKVLWERSIDGCSSNAFRAQLRGREIVRVGRRGKYLIFHLDAQLFMLVHLRMTGQLLLCPLQPDAVYQIRREEHADRKDTLAKGEAGWYLRLRTCMERDIPQFLDRSGFKGPHRRYSHCFLNQALAVGKSEPFHPPEGCARRLSAGRV